MSSLIKNNIFTQVYNSDTELSTILHQHGIYISYTQDIAAFKKQVSPYLVMSELGKGKGCIHLACKKYFSAAEKSTFWDNTEYFQHQPNMTPESVIKLWDDTYIEKGWSRIASLHTSQVRVPYL